MNKKLMAGFVSLAFMIVLLPATGSAQDRERVRYLGPPVHGRGINAREREQQKRIREGIRSGELTRHEARRLEAEQARIRVDEAYARRSGGEFTPRERLRIQRELNHASRNIYRQKHDRQHR